MNTSRTRTKICGLTRRQDVAAACAAGADAIGLVFCERSPRHVDPDHARALVAEVPAFVTVTALFLDPAAELVERVIAGLRPQLLQFHGREDAAFCEAFALPYIKAVSARSDPLAQAGAHPRACGYLLDSHAPGQVGGRGETYDWQLTPEELTPLIVAGGLAPNNVGGAVARLHPWAVDVSSGVEASPGIKDAQKIHNFMQAVRDADHARQQSNDGTNNDG